MKHLLTRLPGAALLLGLLLLFSCSKEEEAAPEYSYLTYATYRPQLMTRATLESTVAALPAQAMHNTGILCAVMLDTKVSLSLSLLCHGFACSAAVTCFSCMFGLAMLADWLDRG